MDQAKVKEIYEREVDMVYRLCYSFLGRAADAEDATQEVFIKLMRARGEGDFESLDHEKAWLVRVASNHCKDVLRRASRKDVGLESAGEPAAPDESFDATLDAVLRLDPKYKDAVYLFYYEGYTTDQIAAALGRPASTVRSHLSEARAILKKALGGEDA